MPILSHFAQNILLDIILVFHDTTAWRLDNMRIRDLRPSKRLLALTTLCVGLSGFLVNLNPGNQTIFAKEKVHQWQKGMLTDVSSRDASRLIDGTSYEKLLWTYTIDDGTYIWKLQRDTKRHDTPLDVTVNTKVDFAIDGHEAFLKDESGKEHSLSVQTKILKLVQ